MTDWTHDLACLREAEANMRAAMLDCRSLHERDGCTEWDGACEACTVRIDYLSVLDRLIELTAEQVPDQSPEPLSEFELNERAAAYLSQGGPIVTEPVEYEP